MLCCGRLIDVRRAHNLCSPLKDDRHEAVLPYRLRWFYREALIA